jgi:hypothetical protein
MNDILNAAVTALEATSIGKHVYEGWPDTFAVYPCASVIERVQLGASSEVHTLTVMAWTKDDSQTVKDLLRTLTLAGYTASVVSIADSLPVPDGAGITVYPITAVYTVIGTTSGTGNGIVYPSLRPIEIEVEAALHCTGGLTIWRIDTEGATITSPCVLYEVTEEWPTSWYCDYTAIIDLIVDGEPSRTTIGSIVTSMLTLTHARQLSYDLSRDKETGYHIARMIFQIQRATGE